MEHNSCWTKNVPAKTDSCHGAQVHEYDCLLLEYVFGNRPDDSQKVKTYVLENIASDPELQKAEILFLGSYGRACEFLAAGDAEVPPPPTEASPPPARLLVSRRSSDAAMQQATRPLCVHRLPQCTLECKVFPLTAVDVTPGNDP